jgi:hypothetical protein
MADDPEKDKHKRGYREAKFCTSPADPPCKNDGSLPKVAGCAHYIDICKPKPSWDRKGFTHAFRRVVRATKIDPYVFDKKYEAHHIVCVAPATKELLGNEKIKGAIEQTEWCINNKDNMMAMPLWGHTIKWYCRVTKAGGTLVGSTTLSAPPFANIPQHDIDHNSKQGYTSEIQEEMIRIAGDVEKVDHKLQGKALLEALKEVSKDFRAELKRRGTERKDGTHNAWKLAQKPTCDPHWYEPFSMADDGKFEELGFPVRDFDAKAERWIEKIKDGIIGL